MAKFGQGFIQSLTQPGYIQGMFNLGATLGQAPAVAAEKKAEKDRLARLDESFAKTMQGTAAAQQGDVSAVTRRMRELQSAMRLAKTAEEKRIYMKEIASLQALIPGAQKTQTTNKAQAILKAEQALEAGGLDPRAEAAFKERIAEMKGDPEAVEQYNKYKIDQFRTQKAQEQMDSEAWLKSKGQTLVEAIKNSDLEALDNLGQEAAGQNFYEEFQSYVTTATQNQKTRDYLEERSLERTKEPNLNYQDAIDKLPEELRESVQTRYDAYKTVVDKGWDGETWKEGLRTRAVNLEKELKDSLYRMQDTSAITDFRGNRAVAVANEETIQKLELDLAVPIKDTDIERRAGIMYPDKDFEDLTTDQLRAARQSIQTQRMESVIKSIRIIDPEYANEKYGSVEDNGKKNKAPQEAEDDLRRDPSLADQFEEAYGYLPEWFKRPSTSLDWDRAYLEGVRSKISPMGTYKYGE